MNNLEKKTYRYFAISLAVFPEVVSTMIALASSSREALTQATAIVSVVSKGRGVTERSSLLKTKKGGERDEIISNSLSLLFVSNGLLTKMEYM